MSVPLRERGCTAGGVARAGQWAEFHAGSGRGFEMDSLARKGEGPECKGAWPDLGLVVCVQKGRGWNGRGRGQNGTGRGLNGRGVAWTEGK